MLFLLERRFQNENKSEYCNPIFSSSNRLSTPIYYLTDELNFTAPNWSLCT